MSSTLEDKRILVLEDNFLIATMTAEMLKELGATVVGALSEIPQAIEALSRDAVDAALLDVNIRGAASTPVAAELQARGLPFVFATGYGDLPGGDWPMVPVIAKPYKIRDLKAALVRALNGLP